MFILSKLLSAITQPLFWLAFWWALALILLSRKRRFAVGMRWSGLAILGALGFQATPDALLRALENQYPNPSEQVIAQQVGVIVLGGATEHPEVFQAHQQVPLSFAAERMTEPLAMMRRYPQFQLVFSGGEGRLNT